jgi:hypothetical protein
MNTILVTMPSIWFQVSLNSDLVGEKEEEGIGERIFWQGKIV